MTPPYKNKEDANDSCRESRRLNAELQAVRAEARSAPDKLIMVSKCFRELGADPYENIKRLTALAGELFGAACALYNRLEKGMLRSVGKWNFPESFAQGETPDAFVCYELLEADQDHVTVIPNLRQNLYGMTDPNAIRYDLQTYMGCPVNSAGKNIGSLCVFFRRNFVPIPVDKVLMRLIASAVGLEEKRMVAEAPLRAGTQNFRHIYEHSPVMIQIIGRDGRITDANPRWLEELGYGREEVLGQKADFFMSSDACKYNFSERVMRLWIGESARDVSCQYVKKNGQVIDVLLDCNATTDPLGAHIILTVVRDITQTKYDQAVMQLAKIQLERQVEESTDELLKTQELLTLEINRRKIVEEEHRANSANFTSIVEHSGDGIFLVDENGTVLYANPATATMFGRSRDSLVGSQFTLPLEPGNIAEVGIVRPGMEPGVAEMRVQLTDWNGVPAYVATLRDITERKQQEERIVRQVALLNAVGRVFRDALNCKSVEDLADTCSGLAEDLKRVRPGP